MTWYACLDAVQPYLIPILMWHIKRFVVFFQNHQCKVYTCVLPNTINIRQKMSPNVYNPIQEIPKHTRYTWCSRMLYTDTQTFNLFNVTKSLTHVFWNRLKIKTMQYQTQDAKMKIKIRNANSIVTNRDMFISWKIANAILLSC